MANRNPKTTDNDEPGNKEEPEPFLCFNNCGFFGRPETMNYCSKCYKELVVKKANPSSSSSASTVTQNSDTKTLHTKPQPSNIEPATSASNPTTTTNRCHACNKRVGLLGFPCRCGNTFCAKHRYFNEHNCQFDYKKFGRDAIAKQNPDMKPKKIDKI